ncbi:ATP-dependent zinc metalloprotease FtsH [Faecalitalea cylindroides]|uniref:ATP-dependent zinc metalloprotease FtsH n=1 Tax=Faecalitalea cylindroides TaxID=39483 RepID=UPI002330FF39|nr:ATP-dependent zinc metalloprotease FtsH [Faecalitalea cylindroides]MDB7951624.1 ATP-dependent zinc metalloprotease FtsH [Faecalitalea cylindroides]MDB7958469.1 ATP-dependent zinc metalloprotease FtsH [Faecalitalea cylindroides]MDB7960351.1 ATP-dependent zinc metalloprotease FtsH [Faecalitalea cylindroides]MDB7962221.1 ATP-dependent zinc metalloprotease FtsH [Faecalitalea cylindroides]MDB7964092.1 ATP-dependent zinc metalloprotease FtsH [Faecalitalea cylindroides]
MNKQKKPLYWYYFIVLIILLLLDFVFIPMYTNSRIEETSYSSFLNQIEEKKVDEVQIENTDIYYTLKNDDNDKTYQTGVMNDPDLVNRLQDANVEFTQVYTEATNPLLYWFATFAIFAFFIWLGNRMFKRAQKAGGNDSMSFNQGGFGLGNLGKSNAKVYVGQQTGKTFKDVAGQEEAKNSLKEIVDFLNDPKKYQAIGAKMPKGALLVGPPGTGKTLLAKAVAGEAGVPFFSISGSEFVEMFVGRGAAKVRDLFKQAREKAPCIVFIDEIDTIGKKRDGQGLSGNDEREQTLNQLLAEMDGFDGSKGVVLLAATNRPDTLDPALTRPGRFDRRIPVELPDLKGREDILRLHAGNVKCSPSIDFNVIARASAGASGADLANIINEGALLAVRDGRKMVVQKDLEEAIETVIAGEQKKGAVISNHERMIVAYHEIGHALVAAKCKNTAPVHKITIIPRTKGALGYTMQVEEEQHNLVSKEEAYQRIMVYTAGRCAEELIFNSITSGASNDIEQATKLARAMITRLGMSDNFGMTALETVNNAYLGGDTSLACSSETASKIDEEVVNLIKKAHDEAYQILNDNKMKLHELAKFLYERETITGEEFMEILNKPAEIPVQSTRA